jgi:hypothetical protein
VEYLLSVRFPLLAMRKAPELAAENVRGGKLWGLALCGAGLSAGLTRLYFRAVVARSRAAFRSGAT